jgi:hypothetical protein
MKVCCVVVVPKLDTTEDYEKSENNGYFTIRSQNLGNK